jgi:hypothetical protein
VHGKVFELGKGGRQRDEIFDLNLYAVAHEPEFGEVGGKGFYRFKVPPIYRRYGSKWI